MQMRSFASRSLVQLEFNNVAKMISEYNSIPPVEQRESIIKISKFCHDKSVPEYERETIQTSVLELKNKARRGAMAMGLVTCTIIVSFMTLAPEAGALGLLGAIGNIFTLGYYSDGVTLYRATLTHKSKD